VAEKGRERRGQAGGGQQHGGRDCWMMLDVGNLATSEWNEQIYCIGMWRAMAAMPRLAISRGSKDLRADLRAT
jgi:hypothetical protein